jgi:hydroxymethylpyrimidine/phosphomethylpyrimidine kinase
VLYRRPIPVAVSIAGSDSGGGAGIQADLKTFLALKVHGTSALTCITAQNPAGVRAIQVGSARLVREQLQAIFEEFNPAAAKTGMLYSTAIIRTVVEFLRDKQLPVVVDPVMISTSGARLLQPAGLRELTRHLFPMATLITPNLSEAEVLLGKQVSSPEAMRSAARELYEEFGCAALVKGGHLRRLKIAVDIFYDGQQELLLSAPFIRGILTHGTGCTYSAAITAFIARGQSTARAVQSAKEYVSQTIARSRRAGRHTVLNWF